jgi:hypothetical protein
VTKTIRGMTRTMLVSRQAPRDRRFGQEAITRSSPYGAPELSEGLSGTGLYWSPRRGDG